MQDIYTYIPETNYVPREYSVAAILLLLFMVLISLVSVLNVLYFYISTFRSMCAVPNMAVFFSSLTWWYIIIIIIMFSSSACRFYLRYPVLDILINYTAFCIAWRVKNFVFYTLLPARHLNNIKCPSLWLLTNGIPSFGLLCMRYSQDVASSKKFTICFADSGLNACLEHYLHTRVEGTFF